MTMVQIDLWNLILLLLAFFGCVGAFGKILLSQVEKRQVERFKAQEKARETSFETQEKARKEAQVHWDKRFSALENAAGEWARVERELLLFKAEIPRIVVMRDDYIRNQTVIEAKLDGLALRLENAQLKGKIQ